jgi:hypothetical protein
MDNAAARQALSARAIEARERFSAQRVLGLWQEIFDDVRKPGPGKPGPA